MTVTDQERKARMGEQGSSTSDVQIDDPRAAHKAGQKAFKELTAPIRGSMALAQLLGVLYGALAVAPYVILVQLGEVLLAAARSGSHLTALRLSICSCGSLEHLACAMGSILSP